MNGTVSVTNNRERLAWGILLAGFAVFMALVVSVPLGINAYLQKATVPLTTAVQSYQGTLSLDTDSAIKQAILSGEPPQTLAPGMRMLTDVAGLALLFVQQPVDGVMLARVQVYSSSNLHLTESHTPRFQVSDAEQEVTLTVDSGRLRLQLWPSAQRPFILHLRTPQGEVTLDEPGQYALLVTADDLQMSVQEGHAVVVTANETLSLQSNQRAEIPTDGPLLGPFVPVHNLIQNGNFSGGYGGVTAVWQIDPWNKERPDQPNGQMILSQTGSQSALRLHRLGEGHADLRLTQTINQSLDLAEPYSLWLQLRFRISSQDLSVCGYQGSECPLFIRMVYNDDNGVEQVWQQGFYASGEVSTLSPYACFSCGGVQYAHERVIAGETAVYDIDLRSAIQRQGALPPKWIKSISLVASGHSFDIEIFDLKLLEAPLQNAPTLDKQN